MCGQPIPGYGQTASSGSTSSSSSNTTNSATNTPATTGDSGSCFVQGGVYTCGTVYSDIDFLGEITVPSNLTVAPGVNIRVNASTKVHVGWCLSLKNGSRIIVANNTYQNHLALKLFDYKCLDGSFSDVVIYTTDPCYDKKLVASNGAGPGFLTLTFINACVDSAMLTRTITFLFVILGGAIVVGGGLYYFVKNRKRQERKAQGLGKRWNKNIK